MSNERILQVAYSPNKSKKTKKLIERLQYPSAAPNAKVEKEDEDEEDEEDEAKKKRKKKKDEWKQGQMPTSVSGTH